MNNKQWQSLLGLAFRAKKVTSGEELVVQSIRKREAKLVIITKDASQNTVKKISDKCKYYNVPLSVVDHRTELGQAIGKAERVVVCVNDEGFTKKLTDMLDEFSWG